MPWPHSRCQSFIPSTPPTISPGAQLLRGGRGPEPGWPIVADGSAERCRSSSSERSWRAYSSICGGRQWIFFIPVIMQNCCRFPIALSNLYNWFSLCLCDDPYLSCFIHLETQEALKDWRFSLYTSLCLHDRSDSPPRLCFNLLGSPLPVPWVLAKACIAPDRILTFFHFALCSASPKPQSKTKTFFYSFKCDLLL